MAKPESLETSEHGAVVHMTAGGVSIVVDCRGHELPRIVYWGQQLRVEDQGDIDAIADMAAQQGTSDSVDRPSLPSILPENSRGWIGSPGLLGHRGGEFFSTRFVAAAPNLTLGSDGLQRLEVVARDRGAGLELTIELELFTSGLARVRAEVRSVSRGTPFCVNSLNVFLPVPSVATEILDFTGRHLRERSPQRHPWEVGTFRRDSRRGRTGSDATLLFSAGKAGFGFRHGEVWSIQTAWSGNHSSIAERTIDSYRLLGGGELLLPGEVQLGEDEAYRSPWIYAAYGVGLDDVSAKFHAYLRSTHPSDWPARPVTLNTWEAVYFEHQLDPLIELAEAGASVGVERYVLDDGWFHRRRSDTAGLGDWFVDEEVWPDGLHPLVDRVRELGMQFGLWFEPEMVSPDSDVARAHPEWLMGPGNRLPLESRHQQVLDLANPDAYTHVVNMISSLVDEYQIDYLKWDHNRDLIEAGHPESGHAGVHDQTTAVYRMIDDLKRTFPRLEIESCSSGGARADLEILSRTDRMWASDCIDALERQQIQRWTALTVPPEMIGAHVGSSPARTTRRMHTLDFRAGTALFGHFGIEWDLREASADDRSRLAEWIVLYKRFRAFLHTGAVVRSDHFDPNYWVHGVVSPDRSEALFAFVAMGTSVTTPPGRIRIPGLDPDRRYTLEPVGLTNSAVDHSHGGTAAWWREGASATGLTLGSSGVQAPIVFPEQLALLHLVAVEDEDNDL